jgi:hypothetical protein
VLNGIICIYNISKQNKIIFIYLTTWKAGSQANHQKLEQIRIGPTNSNAEYLVHTNIYQSTACKFQNSADCLLAKQKQPQKTTTRQRELARQDIKTQLMQGKELIITHISTLESKLELNEGCIPLPMAEPYR